MNRMIRKTIQLTPERAKYYLEHRYHRQRPINNGVAEAYARDILAGRWQDDLCTIDTPIMITPKGETMNGQHRCVAVIRAEKPIYIDIVSNVPEEMFDYIDGGKSRTVSQFINAPNAKDVASIAKFANSIEQGFSIGASLNGRVGYVGKAVVMASRNELLDYVNVNTEQLQSAQKRAKRIYHSLKGGSILSFGGACWLIEYLDGASGAQKLDRVIDEFISDQPKSLMISRTREFVLRKMMTASREHVRVSNEFWTGVVLAMYTAYDTSKGRITDKDVTRAIIFYNTLLDGKEDK